MSNLDTTQYIKRAHEIRAQYIAGLFTNLVQQAKNTIQGALTRQPRADDA